MAYPLLWHDIGYRCSKIDMMFLCSETEWDYAKTLDYIVYLFSEFDTGYSRLSKLS